MSNSEQVARPGIAVTVPYGHGGGTTAVFTGSPEGVRRDIASFFGVDREAAAQLTLAELVLNVSQVARAAGTVAQTLGGTAIPSDPPSERRAAVADAAWAEAAQDEPASQPTNPLVAQIEAALDVPTLQRIWVENQAAFKSAEVMAAWKAKGRVLQQAA